MQNILSKLKKIKWDVDNTTFMRNIHKEYSQNTPYDLSLFISTKLESNIKHKEYLYNQKSDLDFFSESEPCSIIDNVNIEGKSNLKEIFSMKDHIHTLYKYLEQHFSDIKLLHNLKGDLKTTTVCMYIENENTCFITNNFSGDDLLNLLTIKDLNIFVIPDFYYRRYNDTDDDHLLVNIYVTKKFQNEIVRFIKYYLTLISQMEQRIQETENNLNKIICLNLRNAEVVLRFNEVYGSEIKRFLTICLMSIKGLEALSQCKLDLGSLLILSAVSKEFLSLLNSVRLYTGIISKYSGRHNLTSYTPYRLKFIEEIMIEKHFNKKLSAARKWATSYLNSINKNTIVETKGMNKNTVYFEAVQELTSAFENIGSIKKAILFGSVAKGEENLGSDIDIAIELMYNGKLFTEARQRNISNEIDRILDPLNKKLKDTLIGFDYNDNVPESLQKNPIHIINLTFSKKADLKAYEKGRFFEGAITLIDRTSFNINVEDKIINIPYKAIEYVITSTKYNLTYGCIKIFENEQGSLYLYVPFIGNENFPIICEFVEINREVFSNYKKFHLYKLDYEEVIGLLNNDEFIIKTTISSCFTSRLNYNHTLDIPLSYFKGENFVPISSVETNIS